MKKVIGGVVLAVACVTLIGGGAAANAAPSADTACGVVVADYGSGVVSCADGLTSWNNGATDSFISLTDEKTVVRYVTGSGVSEVVVDRANDSLTAYVG